MSWLRCILAVSLGICGVSIAPDASADATCRITGSAVSFGSVATAGATDTVGYIAYECDVSSPGNSGKEVSLQLCVGLGPTPGGTLVDRRMDGIDNAAGANPDQLPFGLFKDSARSSGWGESSASNPPYLTAPAFTVTPPAGAVQTINGSIPVYGRIPDGLVAAGEYAARLPGTLYYGSKNKVEQTDCMGAGGGSSGTDPFSLAVTATVPGSCTALAAAPRMDFGTLTGTRTGVLTSTVDISLECTNRTAWQLGLDGGRKPAADGSRQMCTTEGTCIRYQLIRPQAYGGGRWGDITGSDTVDDASSGEPQTVTVSGTVPDQPLTRAGDYTDTIKVILTY